MKVKRLLPMLLMMVAILLLIPAFSTAENMDDEGNQTEHISDDFAYVVLEDGTAELTGYKGQAKTLLIPSQLDGHDVSAIGEFAFESCFELESVTIPPSVKKIGLGAFYECKGIKNLSISEGTTQIGECAFYGCYSLKKLDIPKSVTSIGADAFQYCSSMEKLSIPESVTSIGSGAFYGCTGLASAGPIGSGCDYQFGWTTSIPDNAFSASCLTSIVIPKSVTSVGKSAFGDCFSLTGVEIPDGVTIIEDYLFSGCIKLTEFAIPDGVTSIGDSAFSGCEELTNLSIPDSVTSIGEDAFQSCDKIVLNVRKGSYAEKYCIENGLRYTELGRQTPNEAKEGYKEIIQVLSDSACALRWDGTVKAINCEWYEEEIGQWKDIVKIKPLCYGGNTVGGIKKDGTVVIAGEDSFSQCYGFDEYKDWTDIVDLADIGIKLFGLKSDGTLVATGGENFGEEWDGWLDFHFSDWHDIRQITAITNPNADFVLFGLDNRGTLHYTGSSYFVPEDWDGMQDVADIDCSAFVYLVLKKDGTVRTGGLDCGSIYDDVESWTDIVQVCAGYSTVGLKSDGTVVTAGYSDAPNLSDWKNITRIYKDSFDNIYGICEDGTVRCCVTNKAYSDRNEPCFVNQEVIESWRDVERVEGIYDGEAEEMIIVGFLHGGETVSTREIGI